MSSNVKAIILALVASVAGVTMNVLIKFSLQDINVFTAGFLRFLFGFILILPFIFYSKFQNFKTPIQNIVKKAFFEIIAIIRKMMLRTV